MNNSSSEEIVGRVNDLFVDLFEAPREKLVPEAHLFQDLSLDSLDAIDLVVSFERVFKIKPPHAEIREIRTLQDVYNLVLRYHDQGHASVAEATSVGVANTAHPSRASQ